MSINLLLDGSMSEQMRRTGLESSSRRVDDGQMAENMGSGHASYQMVEVLQ